jgi:hypothetical protein
LIERIESLMQGAVLIDDLSEKMRQARTRLEEIDDALSALGYNPDDCGWDKPPLH